MGMTMTQKILAAHAGLDHVEAGQLILVNLDRVLGNDITSPVAIREFNKLGTDHVFDKDKVTMVMDHFAPNKDIKAATQCKMCRDFCNEKEVTHFYDVGQMGCYRKKDWSFPVTLSSVQTPTPVPMVHWVHFPLVLVQPIWRVAWQSVRLGLKYRLPSSLN